MKPFMPKLVYFEPQALDYPLGQELYNKFSKMDVEIRETSSHNQIRNLPGDTDLQKYRNAKSTLVVGVRRTLKFDTSKPSAEYAIPLATGCMGHCHYCYLQTTLGSKPYIRVYVNLDEIFEQAQMYMDERAPDLTRFEAACTSDIVGIDHLTHALKKTIEFFGTTPYGHLRFVTKFSHVDHLLDAKHNGKTTFRFSINSRYVIHNFEPGTSSFEDRIDAARKVAQANYPLGFIVAPIYMHKGWEEGYHELFLRLHEHLHDIDPTTISFEMIQHRFTKPAKNVIMKRYPNTLLEMDESKRKYKWGRYGIGKYVYETNDAARLEHTISSYIHEYFPNANILYFT